MAIKAERRTSGIPSNIANSLCPLFDLMRVAAPAASTTIDTFAFARIFFPIPPSARCVDKLQVAMPQTCRQRGFASLRKMFSKRRLAAA
ncbi:hypothetical protein [Rhizobium leguminosarum]|uniref:hypothetical protein n=1 Tax=Rhizobium leguminosarum TaxID=384 RepID=UPI001FEF53E7|nr:hypothetical protein [Rhizobium leguminosarum]